MASKLIQDLNTVANIVGGLGLSIATAQRAMNLDYLESLERLAALAISLQNTGDPAKKVSKEQRDFAVALLEKFAPTRYQYTKTTLKVRLDLAQTRTTAIGAGLGVGVGAIALNASFAYTAGSEYQAAAECTTVIDATSPQLDATMLTALATQAAQSNAAALTVPARAQLDKDTIARASAIIEKLFGVTPQAITES
ncbi:MAG: hypothetical protein AB7O66_01270 [Limisphaerales bacterium]